MDNAVNEALRAPNLVNVWRSTDLQCPKPPRRRFQAVHRLARVLLGDPNIVCGTNTKGEVCLSGGACTALCGPLGCHLAFTAQEHDALSMLRMACNMHLSKWALLRMPRRCTQRVLRTVWQRVMPYFCQATIVKFTTGRNRVGAHVPLHSIVHNAISMAGVIGKPPPVALPLLSFQLMRLPCGRHPLPMRMYGSMSWGGGGAMYASKVKLRPHGFAWVAGMNRLF